MALGSTEDRYNARTSNLSIYDKILGSITFSNALALCLLRFKVGGFATEYGNLLTFATVRGAAHMVPYAQPARALTLFRSFTGGRRLPNTTHPSINE